MEQQPKDSGRQRPRPYADDPDDANSLRHCPELQASFEAWENRMKRKKEEQEQKEQQYSKRQPL